MISPFQQEKFEVLRRIIERGLNEYSFRDSSFVDYLVHLQNEINELRKSLNDN